jgi:hypothetical protein
MTKFVRARAPQDKAEGQEVHKLGPTAVTL